MVRDANCFHPFKDGVLSCIDCLVMPAVCLVNNYIKFGDASSLSCQ